jgi:prepilin peptidase CpaA
MFGGIEIGLWILLIVASITDLLWGKVFNITNLCFMAAGLTCRLLHGGLPEVGIAALAILVAFTLFYPLYLMKTMAAGDVKLLMAVGAWADTKLVIEMGLVAILIGALVGLGVLIRQAGLRGGLVSVRNHLKVPMRAEGDIKLKSHRMPFAPAFLCALLFLKIAEVYQWPLL